MGKRHSEATQVTNEFIRLAGAALQSRVVQSGALSPRTPLFGVAGAHNGLLYVTPSTSEIQTSWGIKVATVKWLLEQGAGSWAIVLLRNEPHRGYLANEDSVIKHVVESSSDCPWPVKQGSYKIGLDRRLRHTLLFDTLDEFRAHAINWLEKRFDPAAAVADAKREAEELRKRGGGESDEHQRLKEYIAGNPAVLGLDHVARTSIERLLPAADRADVVFELADGRHVIVEVEPTGVAATMNGMFQCVKYRALLDAELVLKGQAAPVTAVLAAPFISDDVAELASKLDVASCEVRLR